MGLTYPMAEGKERLSHFGRLSYAASSEEGHERQRILVGAALRAMVLAALTVVLVLLAWRLRALLLLVIVSLFVAALLNPAVVALHRRGIRRSLALALVYAVIIALFGGLGYTFFHPVYTSAVQFAKDLPHLVRQAQAGKGQVGALIKHLHLDKYVATHAPSLQNAITKLGKPALAFGKTVLGGVASLVTIAFLSFFILLEAPAMFRTVLSVMTPERASMTRRIADAIAHEVTGFMLGDFATSVIAGLVTYVALRITGVPFALVISIWVALVDFLPLVGGLLAGVPAVGVAFLHSISAGIVTVIVFLVYQQVENHVLYPLIVSKTVKLNPLWVLLSVLVGAEIGSIIGSTFGAIVAAILAVPAAGSIQVAAGILLGERAGAGDLEGAEH